MPFVSWFSVYLHLCHDAVQTHWKLPVKQTNTGIRKNTLLGIHITKHHYKQTVKDNNFLQKHIRPQLNSVKATDTVETDSHNLLTFWHVQFAISTPTNSNNTFNLQQWPQQGCHKVHNLPETLVLLDWPLTPQLSFTHKGTSLLQVRGTRLQVTQNLTALLMVAGIIISFWDLTSC